MNLSDKRNFYGRILLILKEYPVIYSKAFDKATIVTTTKNNMRHPNGTLEGLSKLVTQSEIDIAVQPITMDESSMKGLIFLTHINLFLLHL